MVQMSLTMGYAILNAAGLSFIGLGVRPPTPEWGIMVAEGASFMVSGEWWMALFPGLALMIAVFCFNLLGDGLRDIVDPQRRTWTVNANGTAQPLLDVHDLTVEFSTRRGIVKAVQHVNISVAKGETLGIVGESGSGKSVTSYAVMRILDRAGRIAEGSVMFSGIDVKAASEDEMRDLRGREMSMIFQNPRAALNPIRKVGEQIEDVLRQHVQQSTVTDRGEKAIEALEQVQIARPARALPRLSVRAVRRHVPARGDRARARLQSAAADRGRADHRPRRHHAEGGDGSGRRADQKRGMSTILITHDLGLAAAYCDRVVVMEKGRVVETAKSADIFANPQHPYTKKLMRATPRIGVSLRDLLPEEDGGSSASAPPRGEADARSAAGEGLPPQTALVDSSPSPRPSPREGRGEGARRSSSSKSSSRNIRARARPPSLSKLFSRKPPVEPEVFRAVDGISFSVGRGESVGLVGESGCGKSTTSMMVMRLLDQTSGRIVFDGEEIGAIMPNAFARLPSRKRASRWCSRTRPTASIRASPRRAPSPIRSCGLATSGARRACAPAARSWPPWSACRSSCSTASRINSPAARRRASASPGPSRSSPSSSSWTSRPPRSTSRCRRWC